MQTVFGADPRNEDQDETNFFNCEMQCEQNDDLAKRSRYYQGQINTSTLKRNQPYSELRPTYIIFICMFDPFGRDEYVYSFENTDKRLGFSIGDESYKMFLNVNGHKGNVTSAFKELMAYFKTSSIPSNCGNPLVYMLDQMVAEKRENKDWRDSYMTWERYGFEQMNKGRAEGLAEGRTKIVENLIRSGLDVEKLSEMSGVPLEEVLKIQKDMLAKA